MGIDDFAVCICMYVYIGCDFVFHFHTIDYLFPTSRRRSICPWRSVQAGQYDKEVALSVSDVSAQEQDSCELKMLNIQGQTIVSASWTRGFNAQEEDI